MTSIVTVTRGPSPLILSMPHPGTGLPSEVDAALNERGRLVEDTDWHMREVYAFAERFQPTIVEAKLSRFVIDLNRDGVINLIDARLLQQRACQAPNCPVQP